MSQMKEYVTLLEAFINAVDALNSHDAGKVEGAPSRRYSA